MHHGDKAAHDKVSKLGRHQYQGVLFQRSPLASLDSERDGLLEMEHYGRDNRRGLWLGAIVWRFGSSYPRNDPRKCEYEKISLVNSP